MPSPPTTSSSPLIEPASGADRPPLTELLNRETESHHRSVERTRYMQALLRGQVDRAGYARYLRSLEPVYEALEQALEDHRGHPAVEAVHSPALGRRAALSEDLRFLHGEDWETEIPVPAPAFEYASSIRRAGREGPHLLVAHAYLRYLGDLSGGQILRGVLARTLSLGGPDGLRFYEYPELDDLAAAKQDYRARIDGLEFTTSERSEVVAEALRGYEAHGAIFARLT